MEGKNTSKGLVVLSYKDLKIYKLAFESAMQIFHLSKEWPKEENFT